MSRTLIRDLAGHKNEVVTINGWVHTVRNQKRMQFIVVRDHTGLVQATHEKGVNHDYIGSQLNGLSAESAVRIIGLVVPNEMVRLNQLEIQIQQIIVENLAQIPIPITDQTNLDQRLDWRFLDLRRAKNRLIFEVQTTIEEAMRSFWASRGFLEIHSPKLMGGASESGAELFRVDYFGGNAYLAQSPQFYKQMAMSAGFDRVFEIGPVFRANPSFTSRHDTEFTSVDVEIAWVDSHEDVMSMEEQWLNYVLTMIKSRLGDVILKEFGVEVVVPNLPFPRLTMAQAYDLVAQSSHKIPDEREGDLDPEAERIISRFVQAKYGHEFVFVTEYPISVRPFYHMRSDFNPNKTRSFDLLWKGLEITTGAQREHRYDRLLTQVLEKGIDPESIKYYLDFFKYGCPPHGGFGFGLTRMLMVLLGVKNVREVTYLYRGPTRLSP